MNNYFTSFIALLLFIQTVNAQQGPKIGINRGDVLITASVGFPNFLTARIKDAYQLNEHNRDQLSNRSTIPVDINVSYQVNNNLAIGAEVSYESAQIKWRENETLLGNDSTNTTVTYRYALNASRMRVLAILNYHFAVIKYSDWYLGFGLGYSHNIVRVASEPTNTIYNTIPSCFLPVSTRTKIGINYHLKENLAVNMEAGIGGPLLSLGITFKV
jgi:hypothetical protein